MVFLGIKWASCKVFKAVFLCVCLLFFCHGVGVIAVALAEKKDKWVTESTTFNKPSIILFFSFSDPCNPQVSQTE